MKDRFRKESTVWDMLLYATSDLEKMYGSDLNGKVWIFYDREFDCIELLVPIKDYSQSVDRIDNEIFELNNRIRKKYGGFSKHIFVAV
ncbi:hypothetical protein [Methanolapillus africanus]